MMTVARPPNVTRRSSRGFSLKKPGEYLYVRMDDNPLGSGGYTLSRGRPPYTELGRAASFRDLPEGCNNLVLEM